MHNYGKPVFAKIMKHLAALSPLDRNGQLLVLAAINCFHIGWMPGQLLEVAIDPPEDQSLLAGSPRVPSDHLLM